MLFPPCGRFISGEYPFSVRFLGSFVDLRDSLDILVDLRESLDILLDLRDSLDIGVEMTVPFLA